MVSIQSRVILSDPSLRGFFSHYLEIHLSEILRASQQYVYNKLSLLVEGIKTWGGLGNVCVASSTLKQQLFFTNDPEWACAGTAGLNEMDLGLDFQSTDRWITKGSIFITGDLGGIKIHSLICGSQVEFSRLTINNRKSALNWMNLTRGHGEKIKFGGTGAIFLVTCENCGVLAGTFLPLSSFFCAFLPPSHLQIPAFLWEFKSLTT